MNLKIKYTKLHKYNLKTRYAHRIKKKIDLNPIKNSGIIATNSGWISVNQINTIKLILKRNLKKNQYFINLIPNFYFTKKPASSRMGKGRGPLDKLVKWIRKGDILVIFFNISPLHKHVISKIKQRLSITTSVNYNLTQW